MTRFRQFVSRAIGFFVVAALLLASNVSPAQVGLGSISGTVTDATGAAVADPGRPDPVQLPAGPGIVGGRQAASYPVPRELHQRS